MKNNNPFISKIYVDKWGEHFNNTKRTHTFGIIRELSFVKNIFLPVYINVGKNLTKGISYTISYAEKIEIKNKVFLIYDVPDYLDNLSEKTKKRIGRIKVDQYPGFLVDVHKYIDIDSFKKSRFGKNSLYKIRKYQKKIESCFDIRYHMYFGDISKKEYDFIFKTFKDLLERRFDNKQIRNNNLDKREWEFYYDLMYDLILDKKASIYVIYDRDKPIAGSFNYHTDEVAIGAIMAFDIDYSKFYPGFTIINKLIEWSIKNKLKYFDFSKGDFSYKRQWSDRKYSFRYHIVYDKNALMATVIAYVMSSYFKLKKYLRAKKINELFNKLIYRLNGSRIYETVSYRVVDDLQEINHKDLYKVNDKNETFAFLRKAVYDFLYAKSEHITNIEVYQILSKKDFYLIKGKSGSQVIQLSL